MEKGTSEFLPRCTAGEDGCLIILYKDLEDRILALEKKIGTEEKTDES